MGSLIAGSRDAALEFSANIDKWQLRVIDLIKFDEAGEMTEIRGHDPPGQGAPGARGRNGNRVGPQLLRLKQAVIALR
jgi:hypothetical protein